MGCAERNARKSCANGKFGTENREKAGRDDSDRYEEKARDIMKKRFLDFMAGRYGADELTKFMTTACLICLVLNIFTHWQILYVLALAILFVSYFRMFSRNYSKRNAENQKYLDTVRNIKNRFAKTKRRAAQSKDFHIYKCPSCGQKIRIPRGKGKICITCPKCRTEFEKRS